MGVAVMTLTDERGPLGNSEFVLLIDDDQPEITEGDGVVEQGMGADDDLRITGGRDLDGFIAVGCAQGDAKP